MSAIQRPSQVCAGGWQQRRALHGLDPHRRRQFRVPRSHQRRQSFLHRQPAAAVCRATAPSTIPAVAAKPTTILCRPRSTGASGNACSSAPTGAGRRPCPTDPQPLDSRPSAICRSQQRPAASGQRQLLLSDPRRQPDLEKSIHQVAARWLALQRRHQAHVRQLR